MITAAGPAGIRPVLDALRDGPVAVAVTGGCGTGKTAAMTTVAEALRARGESVLTRLPGAREEVPAGVAVVLDDAHLLTGTDLVRLTDLAGDPGRTVAVAAEPRNHDPELRALLIALEHRGPPVRLGPLDPAAAGDMLAAGGTPPDPDTLKTVLAVTAGIPFLLSAAAPAAGCGAPAIAESAAQALTGMVRRFGERELETLLVISLAPGLGPADVGGALGLPDQEAFRLVDRVRATGLGESSHPAEFRDMLHRTVADTLGVAQHHGIESALLRTQLELSTLSGELALRLAEHGLRDERLIGPLHALAATRDRDPVALVPILRAAVDCGAPGLEADLADTLARSGHCARAAAAADDLLSGSDPARRAAGVRVAASVAAHDGNIRQAAELFGWLGPYPDAAVGAAAAIAHLGAGDPAAAAAALAAGHTGAPTASARATRTLAEGVLGTVTRPYPAAGALLGQAAAAFPTPVAMPDSAAALATLAALHNGDAERARTIIDRAAEDGAHGLHPWFDVRHRLLRGWTRMQDGRFAAAVSDLPGPSHALHRRDAVWAAALRTAVARRSGDAGGLHQAWQEGVDLLAGCAVDLYLLLPLGELWVAAARLRQQERLAPALEQAREVLGSLGDPVGWALPLHWAGLHAGMLANDPAAVAPHGQSLAAAARQSGFAAALAGAGRVWLQVLAGGVDATHAPQVIAAAHGLSRFGLTSDASRLAGQAALAAADPKVAAAMLAAARDMKASAGAEAEATAGSRPALPRPTPAALSDREREVAELLLLGMPYREIGAQLFISAKTVEHHVARIRRRLGAGSRSELLSMLRARERTAASGDPGSGNETG